MSDDYNAYFTRLAGLPAGTTPHPWQVELAGLPELTNRLIRIPTGFGKTFGVLGAWLWNRVEQARTDWPRRLVWCLPMRVLVEQTVAEANAALRRAGGDASEVRVHALMGGVEAADWHLRPDQNAILIGTQDMMLSRAMNRGWGSARARWPMDFGLLNQDCLWVLDEAQLMDVGLATSAQIQAFREQDAGDGKSLRPCKSWWMSATLQRDWIATSPDTREPLQALPATRITPAQRTGPLWDPAAVSKSLSVVTPTDARGLAATVADAHLEGGRGAAGPTLVIVNRVDQACAVFGMLEREAAKSLKGTDLRLVHSRFRPHERAAWRSDFLSREASGPGTDRIIVATQVVEAGVDISSGVLITELAPWSSLVQRFGRCARWGGSARVIVVDSQAGDDKAAAPYVKAELDAAREALGLLAARQTGGVAPLQIEAFEDDHPELLSRLYPYEPLHLLTRQELDDLFDTSADLSGADIDVSRFIRSDDERDLQVFWRDLPPAILTPGAASRASRDELCAVPFLKARDWLCPKRTPASRAWVWDWLDGDWKRAEAHKLYPGQTVLVASDVGGYRPDRGWDPVSKAAVTTVPAAAKTVESAAAFVADDTEDDESLSLAGWQTIAFHGAQVGKEAARLGHALAPAYAQLLDLAGRWHDAGKAHDAFQGCLKPHIHGSQIAKAPDGYWLHGKSLYRMPDGTQRRGFRHELASTLGLIALVHRRNPDHPALRGPWLALLAQLPGASESASEASAPSVASELEAELTALDANQFDLLLYLVCAHHGKVRMSWSASPADQATTSSGLRIRGVQDGDQLRPFTLTGPHGKPCELPPLTLNLAPSAAGLNHYAGRGWTERVLGLLQRHGPFALAWLEAIVRAADQQATRTPAVDPTLGSPDNEARKD